MSAYEKYKLCGVMVEKYGYAMLKDVNQAQQSSSGIAMFLPQAINDDRVFPWSMSKIPLASAGLSLQNFPTAMTYL